MPPSRPPDSPPASRIAVPGERAGADLPGADHRDAVPAPDGVVAAPAPGRRLSLVTRPSGQRPPRARTTRACGGAAHGVDWPVGVDGPPSQVELPVGASSHLYRLLRTSATGRPACDVRGAFLYVPVVETAEPDDPCGGRVLPFPVGGRDAKRRGCDGDAVPPR